MGITSRGFITFDTAIDGTKTGAEYITKDSKQNMELLDTQLTTIESNIENKVKLNNESIQTVNFILNSETIESLNGKKFASNTDIVKDRTGRTTEQVNRVFYKQACKEFTSNGEAITVNNGMDGYVLQAKLEGQTVKNHLNVILNKTTLNTSVPALNAYLNEDSNTVVYYVINVSNLVKVGSEKFTARASAVDGTGIAYGSVNINITEGLNIYEVTFLKPVMYAIKLSISSQTTSVDVDVLGAFKDLNQAKSCTSKLPLGLSSTQAVVSNLGLKYSFYRLTEDKLSGKVIELGGVGGIGDTLEIKEDGNGVLTTNCIDYFLSNNDSWKLVNTGKTNYYFEISVSNTLIHNKIISDRFAPRAIGDSNSDLGIDAISTGRIRIRPSLTEPTLEDFKLSISSGINVKCLLATPIVTTIPKESMPTILTQLQNQFIFGEGVAPYSVTIKAPVTDGISKSYNVSLLNGYTQTASTATPIVNLLNTGLVRMQMDLTAPSTLLNATLFSVAPELRPVTNAKIPIFVNGVCVLGVVDKTTGNVNLPSVPSASANIYIKTDYRRDI